jgi:O-antigen/teichoic acid export membrane protein
MIWCFNFFNNSIKDDFLWRSSQVFVKEGVSLALFIASAVYLSPEVFGNYSYIMALAFFIVMFSDFGLSTATSTMVAEYDDKNSQTVQKIFSTAITIVICAATLLAILTTIIVWLLWPGYIMYIIVCLPLLLPSR